MLERLSEIVLRAGAIVRSAGEDRLVREKTGPRDLVTKYDSMVQAFLERELTALLPEAGFLGEEDGKQADSLERSWVFIVDPIDGTTNFVQGFRNSSISVALMHNGEIEYGLVHNPFDGELYTAQRGKGAFLNGRPIRTTDRDLEHSLLIFGTALYYRELIDETLEIFNKMFPLVQDIRRFGSAALDLCYVAAGRAGLFFECRLCPWDYAAGGLIAREAGCLVTRLSGEPLLYSEKCSVLAGSPLAYAQMRDALTDEKGVQE